MGLKDETSAKAAEIGDGLIESLGFEPADGKKFGRSAVAEVSDQLSEAGFSVTDALDVSSEAPSKSNGQARSDSKNGSSRRILVAVRLSSATVRRRRGRLTPPSTRMWRRLIPAPALALASVPAPGPTVRPVRARPSKGSKGSTSSSGAKVAAAATAATAAISAKVGQAEKRASGGSGGGDGSDGDVLDVVPFTPDAKAPTGPPTVEQSPAVTGEIPRVDAPIESTPLVVEQRPVLVDNRTIVERPRSVSDLFSGGITGRRRLQARKVRRVIRHIDPWSVLTFSVMFHLCLFAALLLASALVFNVAEEAGTIENLESFIRELGDYETFQIDGQAIFKAAVAIAGIMTLAASVLVVLLTVMFNLLSDLLGGVRITVIEEETVRVKPKDSDDSVE